MLLRICHLQSFHSLTDDPGKNLSLNNRELREMGVEEVAGLAVRFKWFFPVGGGGSSKSSAVAIDLETCKFFAFIQFVDKLFKRTVIN